MKRSVDENVGRNLDYGDECIVVARGKYQVRTDSANDNPGGSSYVRVVELDGEDEYERVYWNVDEWGESEHQAEEVMGAIMGAIKSVSEGTFL